MKEIKFITYSLTYIIQNTFEIKWNILTLAFCEIFLIFSPPNQKFGDNFLVPTTCVREIIIMAHTTLNQYLTSVSFRNKLEPFMFFDWNCSMSKRIVSLPTSRRVFQLNASCDRIWTAILFLTMQCRWHRSGGIIQLVEIVRICENKRSKLSIRTSVDLGKSRK